MDESTQLLKKFFDNAVESDKLNRQKAFPRPKTVRSSMVAKYEQNAKKMKGMYAETNSSNTHMMPRQTFITGQSHCSKVVSFRDLKGIRLREMSVPNIHYGRYLLCRTVVPPVRIIGVTTLVEDIDGEVEDASFYNFFSSFNENANQIFWKGVILIIKEPYLKLGS
jgi:hypothetical protein